MNVWLLKIGENLPIDENVRKMRTLMLAEQLIDRGHECVWWTSAYDHFNKQALFQKDTVWQPRSGLTIRALNGGGYSRNISLRRYIDHYVIAKKFCRYATQLPPPDIIVTAMPDHNLAYEAVRFAVTRGISVLVDIRDPWPDMIVERIPTVPLKFLVRLGLFNDFRRLNYLLNNANGLMSMTQPLLAWGLTRTARNATWRDKVFYIGSEPVQDTSNVIFDPAFRSILSRLDNKKVVLYVGVMGVYYDPTVLVRAARLLNERVENSGDVVFVIGGTGIKLDKVQREAEGLDNVLLPGWLQANQIAALLRRASVGVIPCSDAGEYIPNKVFTYLSAGLPIVSSLGGEFRDLLEQRRFGMAYEPNNSAQLAESLSLLLYDDQMRNEMAENAKTIFKIKFDASRIYAGFVDHIESIYYERNSRGEY